MRGVTYAAACGFLLATFVGAASADGRPGAQSYAVAVGFREGAPKQLIEDQFEKDPGSRSLLQELDEASFFNRIQSAFGSAWAGFLDAFSSEQENESSSSNSSSSGSSGSSNSSSSMDSFPLPPPVQVTEGASIPPPPAFPAEQQTGNSTTTDPVPPPTSLPPSYPNDDKLQNAASEEDGTNNEDDTQQNEGGSIRGAAENLGNAVGDAGEDYLKTMRESVSSVLDTIGSRMMDAQEAVAPGS